MKTQPHSPKADALRRMREDQAEHRTIRASLLAREELAKLAAVPAMKPRPPKKKTAAKNRRRRKATDGDQA